MNKGLTAVVIDTNVLIAANGGAEQASAKCKRCCIERLTHIQGSEVVVLDDQWEILKEYLKKVSPAGQLGVGDAFLKWLMQNKTNPIACELVQVHKLHPNDPRQFEEFPDDPSLSGFDVSDRKFVAASRASRNQPRILNATDRDWWVFCDRLRNHSIIVDFLCLELMQL